MRLPVLIGLLFVVACGRVATPVAAPRVTFAMVEAVDPPAPIALEGTDGTELELEALSFTTRVYGPLAMTELRARFHNPNDHAVEGRFRFALPPRSSVARLAMKIGPSWREAEVAELSAARATYEMIMHRRRDPLLVEQRRDREIAARVAPIVAGDTREIAVAYTSELPSDGPFTFPLRGLPVVHSLDVSVIDGRTEPFQQHWADTRPTDDVRVSLMTPDTVRAGGMVATRVRAPATPAQPFDRPVVVLVETSAAHAADLHLEEALLGEVARLGPAVSIIAYDQTIEHVPDAAALGRRGALGASVLDNAVQNAAAEARRIGARRLVVIGPTAPLAKPADLAAFERVDVLGTNALTDASAMRALAKNGVVLEDAALLERSALDRALMHRAAEEHVVVTTDSAASVADTADASSTIAHVAAVADRDALLAQGDTTKAAVIELAKRHRLMTPYTAMLVLENDADVAPIHRLEAGEPVEAPRPPSPPASTGHRVSAHVVRAPANMRAATVTVSGRLPPEIVQRVVRQRVGSFRACYEDGLRRNNTLAGRVTVKFVIGLDGNVARSEDGGSDVGDTAVIACVVQAFSMLQFPPPEGGRITVTYPFVFEKSADGAAPPPPAPMAMHPFGPSHASSSASFGWFDAPLLAPWSESYAQRRTLPLATARTPTDYVALGESLEASDPARAARAYGSLAALWPERAELLRAAAVRIDRLHAGDPLAIDLLRRAVADRPDQPSGHHLLGLTLVRGGDPDAARAAFRAGLAQRYALRYAGADDLFRKDLALLDDTAPLTRLTMAWETDTSDLDMVVQNAAGERTGSILFATADDGFGPEALDPGAGATTVRVSLRRRGLGGDVLGVVHVIKRNERGDLSIEPRPFAIMTERSTLDLGAL